MATKPQPSTTPPATPTAEIIPAQQENSDLLAIVAAFQIAIEHCPPATGKMVSSLAQQHVDNLKAYITTLESKQQKK